MVDRRHKYGVLLVIITLLLFVTNLFAGSVSVPASEVFSILCGNGGSRESWRFIILSSRLPQAVTALLAGASLSVSGLLLQTAFRNPLAGPSVFGIDSGASLGVAVTMLSMGGVVSIGSFSVAGYLAVFMAAFAGAVMVMAVIFGFSLVVRNSVMLLIVGIMVGYVASSVVSLLNFFATDEGVKSYMVWGMGNFGQVSLRQLPFFGIVSVVGLSGAMVMSKPLNVLMLGDNYSVSLGFRVFRVRNVLLVITGLLTAITTAFCGPISFIGLAVPHISRMILRTSDHRRLIPATVLTGGAIALLCNLICVSPGSGGVIPLNVVTPFIGAPIIIYVILSRRGR